MLVKPSQLLSNLIKLGQMRFKLVLFGTGHYMQWMGFFLIFRERVCNLSLRSRPIESSDFFEPRRKVVLHGEGNVWAPVSWSFDKLREVGVLSYLFLPLV